MRKKQKLGLDVDGSDGATLFINAIKTHSPVEVHNTLVEPSNQVTAGQFIVCVNGIGQSSSAMETALKKSRGRTHLVMRKSIQFRAAVSVMDGLGVSIPHRPRCSSLLIQRVDANGAVAMWNKSNPAQAIKEHDRIVAVNGKHAKASALMKIVKATPKLARIILTIVRAVPTAGGLEGEFDACGKLNL